MIRIGVEDHVRVRVELIVETDLPKLGTIEIRLLDTEEDEDGNKADKLE